ncbi:hypothetical protein D3C76_473620 [compost metagenome]
MLGLGRLGDHAHGAGSDFRFLAHPLGETCLVAGPRGDLGVDRRAAGRNIDQIHAQYPQATRQLDGFVRVPAILDPVGGRHPNEQRQLRRPDLAHRFGDLQGEAYAVFEATAVLVAALVAQRREKLMQQVTMGGMDLDHLETGLQRPLGRGDEGIDDGLDVVLAQFTRCGVFRVESDFRRPHRLPAALLDLDAAVLAQPRAMSAGLAPSVGQLDTGHGALGGDEAGDALQRGDLLVAPEAEVFSGDAPLVGDRDGLGDHQAGATHGATAQMDKVPIVGQAIDGGILAHRRHGDAVGQGQLTQGVWLEQQAHEGTSQGLQWSTARTLIARP